MKQKDKLTNKVSRNKKMLTFLIGILMIGILAGSLFIIALNSSDKALIKEHLESFISITESNKLNYTESLISSLGTNLFYVIVIWLLGISVIGLPIIIFLYFAKAFILGFSISSIIYEYKLKGCLLALLYVFPHHILSILLYTFLAVYSLSLSIRISKTLLAKKTLDFKIIMKRYSMVLVISLVGAIIVSLLEVFLMPNLIRLIIPVLR